MCTVPVRGFITNALEGIAAHAFVPFGASTTSDDAVPVSRLIASQVAGEHAKVIDFLAPGSDSHDLELSPQQVAQVSTADLVVPSLTLFEVFK